MSTVANDIKGLSGTEDVLILYFAEHLVKDLNRVYDILRITRGLDYSDVDADLAVGALFTDMTRYRFVPVAQKAIEAGLL